MIQQGQVAPPFRAPSSKGQTLENESFVDRLAVVLFFLDSLDQPDDQIELAAFDEMLVEFGQRRVQLLGVVTMPARELREATASLAVPLLADENGAMRKAFGGLDLLPFTVIIDRNGVVAAVLERRDTDHTDEVLRAVDALQELEPEQMRAHPQETDMATIWIWRVYGDGQPPRQLPDITGYDVEAVDGRIGTVDEATYVDGEGALVVDTGFWIFGKKRMLPAGVVQSIDEAARTIKVSCTKEEMRSAPEYDPGWRDHADYRKELGTHYEGDPISPLPGPDLPDR